MSESFAALFEESLQRANMRTGEVITAEVVAVEHNFVVVNAGLKSEAYVPIDEFRNDQGEVFALLDRCPHKGGPLSQGIVFGNRVACPLHNWTIGLTDGQAQAPDEGCTPRFEVRVEDGVVSLRADELAGHATDLTRPVAGPVCRKA